MLYETEGIVLSQTALGEYDKIVAVLTLAEGILRAVVKGVRKPASKLSPVTQPFCRAIFQFYKGRTLDRVTQVSLKTSHPGIVSDYDKLVHANYLVELALELLPERQAQTDQFLFFSRLLDCLEQRKDPWIVTQWGVMGLLARAGLAPSLERCVACGTPNDLGATGMRFSVGLGGVVCENCASDLPGGVLDISLGTAKTLQILTQGILGDTGDSRCPNVIARGQVKKETGGVLKKYVEYTLGKRLKSLPFVESIEVSTHKE